MNSLINAVAFNNKFHCSQFVRAAFVNAGIPLILENLDSPGDLVRLGQQGLLSLIGPLQYTASASPNSQGLYPKDLEDFSRTILLGFPPLPN